MELLEEIPYDEKIPKSLSARWFIIDNPDSKAEKKDPESGKEAENDTAKKADKTPKAQAMNVDVTKKKEDDKW